MPARKPKPGKKRKAEPGINIPPRAFTELCELLRHGARFDAACNWVGFYKIEVFEHVKRKAFLTKQLTEAVEQGKTADSCQLWLDTVRQGHKGNVAMQLAGINGTMLSNRRKVDQQFAMDSLEAEQLGTDHLEDIAMRRAVKGSDVLLMFLLKARDRQRFADSPPQVAVVNETINVTTEERHELGRKIAFALRHAAAPDAGGGGAGNGHDPAGHGVDTERGPANGGLRERGG